MQVSSVLCVWDFSSRTGRSLKAELVPSLDCAVNLCIPAFRCLSQSVDIQLPVLSSYVAVYYSFLRSR